MNQASELPKISGYQVEQQIGQGSFALVYAARHTLDLRQPKRALLELIVQGDDEEKKMRQRTFKRTAEILEKLSHPSIPKAYSLFEHEHKLYLVQEFIDGINYANYLDGTIPPLSIGELEKVFWEVLEGLAQLHQAKIVHRDIKPSNLMRRQSDGSTVIVDFGSACDLSSLNALETTIGDLDQSLGHTRIYTPGYAHPQQRDGMATATAQWDLYALAKTIVALRLGKNPPWNQPVEVTDLGFSEQVTHLLQEMLKVEDCQLIDAWDAVRFESSIPEIGINDLAEAKRVKPRRKRNRKGLWIGGAAAVALSAIAAGIYLLPEYTTALIAKIQAPFAPKCPTYVKNQLDLPVPDRGFAARFYYPEGSVAGDSSLEVLREGALVAQGTDVIKGFIWVKSLADGSSFPPGNYKVRLVVPESLPYEKEVSLDPDFPVSYLGNAAAVQVSCAARETLP
ncbi:MAG: serine/threonine-protein kinase [Cyanobacteria bacterium P01_G01_bin.39]